MPEPPKKPKLKVTAQGKGKPPAAQGAAKQKGWWKRFTDPTRSPVFRGLEKAVTPKPGSKFLEKPSLIEHYRRGGALGRNDIWIPQRVKAIEVIEASKGRISKAGLFEEIKTILHGNTLDEKNAAFGKFLKFNDGIFSVDAGGMVFIVPQLYGKKGKGR